MSDTLKTNEDKSLANIPVNDFQPLFQDDDEEMDAAPPKRRGRIWLIVVSLLLIVALIGGYLFYSRQRADAAKVQYTTAAVTVGNISKTVSASGPLQPKAEYDMSFGASGQISEIDVHVGQQVTAGTVLGKVTSPALDIAVQQAQIAVNNAQENYNTAVTNGLAQTTIDADNNTLQTAKLQLQTAQNNQAANTLKAPANAIVASINDIVGQNVGASSSSGGSSGGSGSGSASSGNSTTTSSTSSSAAFVLVDTSGFTVTAAVNEADIASVQVNQPVRFTLTGYPSQTFRATVTSVGIVGTTTSGVVTYPVVLTVDMSTVGSAHLYAGMTATANITTGQRIGVPLVNNSAFTFTTTALQAGVISRSSLTQIGGSTGRSSSQQSVSSRRVVLVLRNNKLVPVLVTVGLTNGTYSEVVSGLNENDQVVVSATGGAFSTLSTSSSGTGSFRTGGFGGGTGGFGGGTGGTRSGGTGGTGTGGTRSGSGG